MPEALDPHLARIERVAFVACGTSWHAALSGKTYVETLARLPVEVDIASEYRYRDPVLDERVLVVVVTQSGETADTIAALREARRRGAITLAITNAQGSMATREAHATFLTKAGPEVGVAATKTFTAQVAAAYLLALGLAERRGTLPDLRARIEDLLTLPHLVQSTIASLSGLRDLAVSFAGARDFLYLGRGILYPMALEGALKLKEISYIHAEGYPAGELKHGPIALIDPKMPIVALIGQGVARDKMLSNVQEVRARGGILVSVCHAGDEEARRLSDHVIEIPRSPELLSPFVAALPMQLFAYHLAVALSCDVDQPRNLAKSVTVE
ncbi:MAG: isomerizing glutamine--fructose-6-phosphate transaminase [Acidobacteriota bacterium]